MLNVLAVINEKSVDRYEGQHFALPIFTNDGSHKACTGLHWVILRMMEIELIRTLPAIAAHLRNALRHVLLPIIRIIKRATATLPVASELTANGWAMYSILAAFLSCSGFFCR